MATEVKALNPPAWVLSALVVVLLFLGAGYADKTRLHWVSEEPPPDRIVGIEWRCTHAVNDPPEPVRLLDLRGAEGCEARDGGETDVYKYPAPSKTTLTNRRLELTIRTAQGTSYTVDVSPTIKVALNDEWPPK